MKVAFLSLRRVIQIASSISYTLIGYVFPVLSAIETIHNDELSENIRMVKIKESLMYWIIIIVSGYFERIVYYLYLILYFRNMPDLPIEIRLLYFIWLLNYGGVNILYKYVISPLFKDFEPTIDQTISYMIAKIQQKINRHIQHIVWQILFSPDEGMISGNLRQILAFLYNLKSKLHSKQNSDVNQTLDTKSQTNNIVIFSSTSSFVTSAISSSSSSMTSQSLGKLLLVEFTQLMTEGIILEAGTSTSFSSSYSSGSSSSSFHPCKLSLIRKGFTIQIESHHSNQNNKMNLNATSKQPSTQATFDHHIFISFPLV